MNRYFLFFYCIFNVLFASEDSVYLEIFASSHKVVLSKDELAKAIAKEEDLYTKPVAKGCIIKPNIDRKVKLRANSKYKEPKIYIKNSQKLKIPLSIVVQSQRDKNYKVLNKGETLKLLKHTSWISQNSKNKCANPIYISVLFKASDLKLLEPGKYNLEFELIAE